MGQLFEFKKQAVPTLQASFRGSSTARGKGGCAASPPCSPQAAPTCREPPGKTRSARHRRTRRALASRGSNRRRLKTLPTAFFPARPEGDDSAYRQCFAQPEGYQWRSPHGQTQRLSIHASQINATVAILAKDEMSVAHPHSPLARAGKNQAGKVLSCRLFEPCDASARRVRQRLASLMFAGNSRDAGAAWGCKGAGRAAPLPAHRAEPHINSAKTITECKIKRTHP